MLTSLGRQSLSVLFYIVRLSYSHSFTKYLDAETVPELEPSLSELPANVSGNELVSWSDVSTAVRYVDTVGIFVEELLLQSHLNNLTEVFRTQLPGRRSIAFYFPSQLFLEYRKNKLSYRRDTARFTHCESWERSKVLTTSPLVMTTQI